MKKKVWISGAVILAFFLAAIVYCFTPKTFLKDVDPASVDHIDVFDGTTGTGFTITDEDDIENIVRNIQGMSMKRTGISLGNMGYGLKISFIDENDRDVAPLFIINSAHMIRKDPFFYGCEGELCYDYIRELEPDMSVEASAADDVISICIDGVTYYGLGEAVPVEPDESVIEYVEIPAGGDATITAFARLEEGMLIVCRVDGEWYKFHSMEALASSQIRLEE